MKAPKKIRRLPDEPSTKSHGCAKMPASMILSDIQKALYLELFLLDQLIEHQLRGDESVDHGPKTP